MLGLRRRFCLPSVVEAMILYTIPSMLGRLLRNIDRTGPKLERDISAFEREHGNHAPCPGASRNPHLCVLQFLVSDYIQSQTRHPCRSGSSGPF